MLDLLTFQVSLIAVLSTWLARSLGHSAASAIAE